MRNEPGYHCNTSLPAYTFAAIIAANEPFVKPLSLSIFDFAAIIAAFSN
jgi:hypothetical protein